MLGLDLDSWNNLMLISLIITALAAVVLAVSTTAAIRLQKQESLDAGIRIAEAKEGAAKANERTAQAELQLEQLRLQMAPRRINEPAFLKELKGKPKPKEVEVLYLRDDAECFHLASAFMILLHNSHWPVGRVRVIPSDQRYPDSTFEMPSTIALAAQPVGVTVVTSGRSVPEVMDEKIPTPFGTLYKAVFAGLGRVNGGADASLSEGKLRIVVAPKEGQ